MSNVEATAYLQLVGTSNPWARSTIVGAKVIKVTQNKPDAPAPGAVVVKVKIRLPLQAFEPLEPEATVIIPDSFIQQAVAVEAIDPADGEQQ